jgi:hypothetical protein
MKQSEAYKIIRQAILWRKQVTCLYQGRYREVCPHILGYKSKKEKALVFQFAGQTGSNLPPRGEWRCFFLSQVTDPQIRHGPWHAGDRHRRPQACVDIVDLDVNLLGEDPQ